MLLVRPEGDVPCAVKYELYTFRPINQVPVNQYMWESRVSLAVTSNAFLIMMARPKFCNTL